MSALKSTLGDYNQSAQRVDDLQGRAQRIPIVAPIVREGHGTVSSTPMPGTNASVLAHQVIGARVNAEQTAQSALGPKLDSLAEQVRQQTAQRRAQVTQQGANALLAGVGVPGIPTPSQPAQAQARPTIAMHLIEPGNAASLKITPPSANAVPGPNPVSSSTGAPPIAGVRASSPSDVIGQFNGRDITRAESDRLSGALPTAAGPVVMGPNGSYAFSTGAQDAATPLSTPTSTPPPQQIVPPYRSIDTFAQRDADKARDAELGRLNSVIDRLGFGPDALNNPGERQLYAQLINARNGLVQHQGTLAGSDVNSQRDAATSLEVSSATQAGENARNAADNISAMDRTVLSQAGETSRALLQPPIYEKGPDGTLLQISGTAANKVTGANGSPVLLTPPADPGAITASDRLRFASDQMTAINKSIADLSAMGQDTSALEAQRAQYQKLAASLMGAEEPKQPTVPDGAIAVLRANPDLADAFDKKYGKGMAAKYLGGHK